MPTPAYPFPPAAAAPAAGSAGDRRRSKALLAPLAQALLAPLTQVLLAPLPAADAELVIPCERDRSGAGEGTLSPAQGGLDNPRTTRWLLKNLEGSAKVFDRRKQLYEGVLGEMGAAERRGEMKDF